jgi:hypothetical protein
VNGRDETKMKRRNQIHNKKIQRNQRINESKIKQGGKENY